MGHVVSRQDWGTVDVDTTAGRVFLQQEWRYTWTVIPPTAPWTLAEKRSFHHETDRRIWGRWSNRIRLRVTGAAAFSRTFAAGGVPINFDVRWVTTAGHWQVNAHKTPPGTSINAFRQNVDFAARIINLYTSKLPAYSASNAAGVSRPGFRSTPHEFGHALGNPDEYVAGSPHLSDAPSTMNVGNQIRERHLALVLATLNTMIPGCVFSM
jgi:hypothetical protein